MTARKNMRTFYTLLLTQTLSIIGSRISSLAVGIWVFNETGNATPLTLVAFFLAVPQVLVSGVSGVLADRWDRRYVMMISDAGQALGTLLLLVSFASNSFELWHLYLVATLQSLFSVFQGPALMASVTMLVPDEKRERANSIQQMTGPAANIVAPVITGLLYAFIGVTGAITIDLVTFLIAVLVIFNVSIPRPEVTEIGHAERGSVWFESFTGLRFLRQRKILFQIVLYVSFINFMVGGVMVLSLPYILARTGSEAALGAIQSVTSIGALIGAVIIGAWGGTRPRIHTIMPALIFGGLALMVVGTSRSSVALGASMFLFMLPLPFINTLFISLMQAKTPPDIQGRVFAVLGQFSMLLLPLAYLITGPLADRVFEPAVGSESWERFATLVGTGTGAGMGLMFVIAGFFVMLSSVLMYVRPAVRHMEADMPDYKPSARPASGPLDTPIDTPAGEVVPSA
jgi:MFS family permease